MNKILKVIGLATIILSLSETSNAKDWRGIVPLHSTRADVTRLLGPSPDANNIRARYFLEKEDVYIVFSSDEPYPGCTSEIAKDAVLLIQITLPMFKSLTRKERRMIAERSTDTFFRKVTTNAQTVV
jgi:hypothetical protein